MWNSTLINLERSLSRVHQDRETPKLTCRAIGERRKVIIQRRDRDSLVRIEHVVIDE